MSNIFLKFLGSLTSASGLTSYQPNSSINSSTVSNTSSTAQSKDTPSFSTVMTQLNNNLSHAVLSSDINSYDYGNYSYKPISYNKLAIMPNINAIVSKIKNDNNDYLDVETQIRTYLIQNYGGSKSAVIQNFAGVTSLPQQAISMQDMLFENIVKKIAVQVREDLYKKDSALSSSIFYSDDSDSSVDTSSYDSSSYYLDL